MPVKIRLARRGRKRRAIYDVVVADARAPRDGRFIEKIGKYNPNTDPATIELDDAKAFDWVMKGAQPTDTVRAMLSYRGIMLKKHLQIGVNKGAITQEEADKKFEAWLTEKEGKIQAKRDQIAKDVATSAKARKEAEAKVKEARAEALKKKAEAAAPKEESTEAPAEEAEAVAEAPAEEAPAEVADEAPAAEAKAEEPVAEEAAEAKEEVPEAPAEEEAPKVEEAPAAEEAPAEEPVAEATEEPTAEAKEEKATEAAEDPKAEAAKEAPAKPEEEKKEE